MTISKAKQRRWLEKQKALQPLVDIDAERRADEEIKRLRLERERTEVRLNLLDHLAWGEMNVNGENGTLRGLVEHGALTYNKKGSYGIYLGKANLTYILDGKPLYFTDIGEAKEILNELCKDRNRFQVIKNMG